jgi:hypothetical protein
VNIKHKHIDYLENSKTVTETSKGLFGYSVSLKILNFGEIREIFDMNPDIMFYS